MKPRFRYIVLGAALATLGLFGWRHHASAQALDPPSQLSIESAARLDRAIEHIKTIRAQADKDVEPYVKEVEEVCARPDVRIDPRELGRSVTVDFVTRVITRGPAKMASAAAANIAEDRKK